MKTKTGFGPEDRKIDLVEPIATICNLLGFDQTNVKRITLEPGRAVILAYDVNEKGSKYVQIGTSDAAALYERTFEIRS